MPSIHALKMRLAYNLCFWLALPAVCLSIAGAARAATYYVGPTGSNSLSTSASSPGSLTFALVGSGGGTGAAQSGDSVILENGSYDIDSASGAWLVYNSGVTFRAQNWHGATIENTAGANIWTSTGSSVDNITCQGMVFGPCASPTPTGYSGGANGGTGWQFLDCVFIKNDGFSFTANNLVYHCVFTDGYLNEFDSGGNNFLMRNSIVRRADRADGDIGDYVGNKVDGGGFTPVDGMNFDGVEFYDNKGSGVWFDTNLRNWTVQSCTFFANHGGNFWFDYGPNIDTNIAATTTSYADTNNDISVGALIMADTGRNYGTPTAIQSMTTTTDPATDATVYVYHLTTALPYPPAPGDHFAEQAGSIAGGTGLITEANPNGEFINNVTYDNTDEGVYEHGSGDGYDTDTGGLLPTTDGYYMVFSGNTFAYDEYGGIHFDGQGGLGGATNPGNPTRGFGPTTVNNNNFKFSSGAWSAWGAPLLGLPSYYGIVFDYNDYDPDSSGENWGFWWYPGTPTTAGSIAQLQSNFGDEEHGNSNPINFTAASGITTGEWPAATDTNWSDIYYPKDPSSPSVNSDYQVKDDETPYIQNEIAGKSAGQSVNLTVFGHTRVIAVGSVWQTDVFDYSGGYVTVTMNSPTAIDSIVPPYAQLTAATLPVTLNSTGSYGIMATYGTGSAPSAPTLTTATPGTMQVALSWSITDATSYTVLRSLTNGSGYKQLATGLTTTSYKDAGLTNGTTYYYVVTATNTYGTSLDSNQLSATPEPYTGFITGTNTAASTSTYNLTTLGSTDWAHWNGTYNHKSSGGGDISDVTQVGGGNYGSYHETNRNVSWTDGTPVTSNGDDQNYIWCNNVSNAGWTFTAPADTTTRTLSVLLGGATGATIKVVAHLSDDGAGSKDYTSTVAISATTSTYLYTFTYAAASAGQTIKITLTNTAATAASADLDAAWLIVAPPAPVSSVTLNPPKVLGGHSSTGTVTLASAAPAGGEVVTLSSSNPSAATTPASVTVAAGAKTATFHIGSTGVQATTNVTISATAGSVTKTASLEVTFAIFRISFSPDDVPGGHTSTGTVTVSAPAPANLTIDFKSSNAATVLVPRAIVIPAGATQGLFKCYTVKPTVATVVSIEAYANGAGHLSEDLTVEP